MGANHQEVKNDKSGVKEHMNHDIMSVMIGQKVMYESEWLYILIR